MAPKGSRPNWQRAPTQLFRNTFGTATACPYSTFVLVSRVNGFDYALAVLREARAGGQPDLRVECLTRIEQVIALRAEWFELEAAVDSNLPFQTWEWTVAWWRHLRENSSGVRDHLRVCVVRDGSNRVVAIAPLILTERPAVGPLRVRYLQFVGADPNITEIRTMLCEPALVEPVHECLRDYLEAVPDEWDWVTWTTPDSSGSAHPQPSSHTEDTSAFVLALASDWQTMKAQLGRNLKESLRKCYNSLRRDGLTSRMEVLETPAAVEMAMDEFFRLHAERAELTGSPVHPNVFSTSNERAFLAELCHRLAERGVARVYRLRVAGEVVAMRIGFQMGQSLYLYYSGWKSEYGRYSVMTTLLAEIIQDAIARGVLTVNLSTGNDVSKTRWRPREVIYRTRLEFSPSAGSHTRYLGFRVMRTVGSHEAARGLVPGILVRRSEGRRGRMRLAELLSWPGRTIFRLHALIGAAAVLMALDLLDKVLDHKVLLLPSLFERFFS